MSFKSVLENIAQRLDEVLGSVVIGDDGIVVERHIASPGFDAELTGVEYIGGCRDIKRATESLESGEVEEVTIVTEKTKTLMRSISPGYYLVLVMTPRGSLGRGRFELKRATYELAPEFL